MTGVRGTDLYGMYLYQDDSAQTVTLFSGTTELIYTQPDCTGVPFSNPTNLAVIRYDGSWWVQGPDSEIDGEQTLLKSYRYTDTFDPSIGQWEENLPCFNHPEPYLGNVGKFHVTYDPPTEWLNAAYPLTLVQKP